MSVEDLTLEEKVDQILDALPIIRALGEVLVQRKAVNQRVGLNKNTLGQNDSVGKFEEIGRRRTLIEIKDVAVVRKRKSTRKQAK